MCLVGRTVAKLWKEEGEADKFRWEVGGWRMENDRNKISDGSNNKPQHSVGLYYARSAIHQWLSGLRVRFTLYGFRLAGFSAQGLHRSSPWRFHGFWYIKQPPQGH